MLELDEGFREAHLVEINREFWRILGKAVSALVGKDEKPGSEAAIDGTPSLRWSRSWRDDEGNNNLTVDEIAGRCIGKLLSAAVEAKDEIGGFPYECFIFDVNPNAQSPRGFLTTIQGLMPDTSSPEYLSAAKIRDIDNALTMGATVANPKDLAVLYSRIFMAPFYLG